MNLHLVRFGILMTVFLTMGFVGKTVYDFQLPPASSLVVSGQVQRQLIVDRQGERLVDTYENRWNEFDQVAISAIPDFQVKAFLTSEDRKFYSHWGVDWQGRLSSLYAALRTGQIHRGASTITEQVVRMLTPRPRTFWSRWIETWEAYALEARWDKVSILEFYLNQVPYSGKRRGVAQAARYYFGRDMGTLNNAEMLSLAVLVRAPAAFDPRKHSDLLLKRVEWLAKDLGIAPEQDESIRVAKLSGFDLSRSSQIEIEAGAFSDFARKSFQDWGKSHGVTANVIETTLDGGLQNFSQNLLSHEIENLKKKNVNHGALLVADHQTGEILSWAVAGGTSYNTVLVPRQPGSTLKPFLYGLALQKGWTPATVIIDEPLVTAVGRGVHAIRNYSREYYGPVTMREALGNSLNTPAIKTVKFVTPDALLDLMKRAQFSTLKENADFYGEGLALGSSEVTLFDLVQAYTLFSSEGRVRPLRWFKMEPDRPTEQVLDPQAASLVSHILADPKSRLLEFGATSILNFPAPTSVKTGTATDYRDAWAVGFNGRYVVGVWMGDLDRRPTEGNTGARGPALILRSVFNYLNQEMPPTKPLPLNQNLVAQEVCKQSDHVIVKTGDECQSYTEYFIPGTELNAQAAAKVAGAVHTSPRISFPLPLVELAWDPRLPASAQALELKVENVVSGDRIRWWMNEKYLGETSAKKLLWPIMRGKQKLSAQLIRADGSTETLRPVPFIVK